MIVRDHPDLSLSRQCQVLAISRSSFYYAPKGESPENLALMRRIDELMKYPFYGSRQMVRQLRREDLRHGRHRVRRLMRLMGGSDLSSAENQRPASGTPSLSLSSQGNADRPSQPGLVRHHLHPGPARLPIPRRDHGLGNPPTFWQAAVKTPWTPGSASRPWTRLWPDTASRRYGTDQGSQFTSGLHRCAQPTFAFRSSMIRTTGHRRVSLNSPG